MSSALAAAIVAALSDEFRTRGVEAITFREPGAEHASLVYLPATPAELPAIRIAEQGARLVATFWDDEIILASATQQLDVEPATWAARLADLAAIHFTMAG